MFVVLFMSERVSCKGRFYRSDLSLETAVAYTGVASSSKKLMSGGMKFLMSRPALFNFALKNAPIVNSLPRGMIYNDLNDWGKEREIPEFAKESFNEMWKKNKVK